MNKSVAYFACLSTIVMNVTLSTPAVHAASFGECEINTLKSGDLAYVAQMKNKKCWKKVRSKTLHLKDHFKGIPKDEPLRFAYIFKKADVEYDPIFVVKMKELSTGSKDTLSTKIQLLRSKITTFCNRREKSVKDGHTYESYGDVKKIVEIGGDIYQSVHQSDRNDVPKVLRKFHLVFRNSKNTCESTASKDLRKFFAIADDITFPESKKRLATIFNISSPAMAAGKDAIKYKKIRVRLTRGTFKTGFTAVSFRLDNNREYDLVMQNLSEKSENLGLRQKGKRIKIRN